MTRTAVCGAGGAGGYVGARLARAGAEVHFIARGAQLRALREHGVRVRSVKGDFHVQAQATDDPADIGPCQFALCQTGIPICAWRLDGSFRAGREDGRSWTLVFICR
jgi:ketopantoate reductase